ncbi:MAG TPA: hypothetical protein PLY57_12970 [Deltaproteobacteria bacterium]|nr:hypothetical protein [Deltaproteobacteria bacterium]
MAERESRERIQSTTRELEAVKGELARRYGTVMSTVKPLALVVAGYIGMRTAMWVLGTLLSLVWKYSILFLAMVAFLLLRRGMKGS